jgi:hypothetical protein
MQVGGGNRNAKNCPVDGDGKRDWSFSLWDCSDRGDLCTYRNRTEMRATSFLPMLMPRRRLLVRLVPVRGV